MVNYLLTNSIYKTGDYLILLLLTKAESRQLVTCFLISRCDIHPTKPQKCYIFKFCILGICFNLIDEVGTAGDASDVGNAGING
jgi:hypothetical protein